MTSPEQRITATLQVVSPCEHGIEHEILELPASQPEKQEFVWFSTKKCVDSKGVPREHLVTKEKYPKTVRRR